MKLPILLALAVAAPAVAQPAPARDPVIGITMTNHGIFPARIALRTGQHYTLAFANRSDRRHDFAVRSFFQDAGMPAADRAKLDHGRISLPPGGRATLRLIAPANRGGRYEFSSTQLADANSGLKGNIFIR